MAEPEKEPAALPLADLCEKELLDRFLASETPDPAFINLEPGVRVRLFSKLKDEILQMKEVEPKWQEMSGMTPYIDARIHLIPGRGSGDPFDDFPVINQWSYETNLAESNEEEEDDDDDEKMTVEENSDGAEDGDDRSDSAEHDAETEPKEESSDVTVAAVHSAEAEADTKDGEEPDFTRWTQNQLYSDSPGSDLKDPETPIDPVESISFANRISSHLLYYRIVVTYAMPPSVEVEYPVCHWKIKLKHTDGISLLEFMDSNGQAHVKFTGTAEASEDALGTLNYLTGEKCLHTYDWVIAGTVA